MIRNRYKLVSDLFNMQNDPAAAGQTVIVRGWIRTNRNNGHIGFLELNDGSCFLSCQVVYDMDGAEILKEASRFLTGCSVEVSGKFIFTPGAKQPFEIHAQEITLLGGCDTDYPMQKKRHSLDLCAISRI